MNGTFSVPHKEMLQTNPKFKMHRRITSDFVTNYDHSFNLNHQSFADDAKQIKDRKLYQNKEVRGKYFFGEPTTPSKTNKQLSIDVTEKK